MAVGSAIMLAAIRSIYDFQFYTIWFWLYNFFNINLFADIFAIGIDSGSTAAGPMSVSFIMPLIIGLYSIISSDKLGR